MTTEDRNKLVEENIGLIFFMAKKYSRYARRRGRNPHFDDLLSDAQWGMVLASRNFDPDKKVPFHTWAATCIRYVMRQTYHSRQGRHLIDMRTIGGGQWMDDVGQDCDVTFAARFHEIAEAIDSLPEKEREALSRWSAGELTRDIGQQMGFSQTRACQYKDRAIKLLRRWAKNAADRAAANRETYAAAVA